jgi:hypothetical protein
MRKKGPLLKCPAHQLLFDASETSLERSVHAIINLAYDHDLYDPSWDDRHTERFVEAAD